MARERHRIVVKKLFARYGIGVNRDFSKCLFGRFFAVAALAAGVGNMLQENAAGTGFARGKPQARA